MTLDTVVDIRFLNIRIIGSPSPFLMGQTWFRQGEIVETATRQAIDVNEANLVNANDSDYALAA